MSLHRNKVDLERTPGCWMGRADDGRTRQAAPRAVAARSSFGPSVPVSGVADRMEDGHRLYLFELGLYTPRPYRRRVGGALAERWMGHLCAGLQPSLPRMRSTCPSTARLRITSASVIG
jgi:hypothetical protein